MNKEIETILDSLQDEMRNLGVDIGKEYKELHAYILWYLQDASNKLSKHSKAYLEAKTEIGKLSNKIAIESTYNSLLDLKWFIKSKFYKTFLNILKDKVKEIAPKLLTIVVKIISSYLIRNLIKNKDLMSLVDDN